MKLNKYDLTSATPVEVIPNAAAAFSVGQALKLDSGAAAACAPTDKPVYLCMKNSAAEDNDPLPVIRVNPQMELAAELDASGAALIAGNAVTLSADGIGVTATTAAGVFTVTGFATAAKAAGDTVYGRIL